MLTNKSRRLLMLSALSGVIAGCTFLKKSIKSFGVVYEYLSDPEGKANSRPEGVIVIEDADFSTASFRDIYWSDIRFVNCDFGGQYRIYLFGINNCEFERCSFSGILNFGNIINTKFIDCTGSGKLFLLGESKSKNVVFERCSFSGLSPEKSRDFAAVGTSGEATFLDCTFYRIDITGDRYLNLTGCTCDFVTLRPANDDGTGGVAILNNSNFYAETSFQPGNFINLAIKQCKFEKANFQDVKIDEELLIENCSFKSIDLYVEHAKQVTMKNSTVYGDGQMVFDAYAAKIENALIDNCEFYNNGKYIRVSGGIDPDNESETSYVNKSIVIRNSKIPFLRSVYVNSPSYTLEGCTIDSADFNHSRFGSFTIKNTKINRSINFTATQAKMQDISGLYGGGLGLAQVEGSNIKFPN